MKKLLATLLCAALLLATFAPMALAEGDNYVHIIGRNLGYALDGNNEILHELEKRTGLEINWELWPTDGYAQQCQYTFASGDYPDAMEVWWNSYPNQFIELIEDGIVQPLNDLVATYGPNIQLSRNEKNYYDYGDGNIWGIPCRVLEDGNTYCIFIRQDWLDKLGLPVPTSSQEYYDTLKAFQANAELLTGSADTFCGHGSNTAYFPNCLSEYVYSEYGFQKAWNNVDGEMVYYVNMPGYKDALAMLRKFYLDGLIEPEYMLMNRDQFLDKWYTDIYGACDFSTDVIDPKISSWTRTYYEACPGAQITIIPPFADANGDCHLRTVNQTIQCVVFEDAKHAENVIKLLDYLATREGMLLAQFGIEGKHWDYDENGNVVSKLTTDEERAAVGINSYAWIYRLSYFTEGFSHDFDEIRSVFRTSTEPTPVMPTTPSYVDNKIAMDGVNSTYVTRLICDATIDFDAEFDQYVKEWNEAGGAEWTKEINEYWKSR